MKAGAYPLRTSISCITIVMSYFTTFFLIAFTATTHYTSSADSYAHFRRTEGADL